MKWAVACIALAITTWNAASGQTTTVSPVAEAVERAQATVRLEGSRAADRLAGDIASNHGRSAVPALLDALSRYELTDPRRPDAGLRFILRALAEAVDPADEEGLRSSSCWVFPRTSIELAMVILCERTSDAELAELVAIASRPYRSPWVAVHGPLIVCGHLRARDSDGLDTLLDDTLKRELGPSQRRYFRALIPSRRFRYHTLKEERDREAYARFERCLWRAWGTVPLNNNIRGRQQEATTAGTIVMGLKTVDDRFLLRLFGDDETTEEELRVGEHLINITRPITIKDELQSIAESGSRNALRARSALKSLLSRDLMMEDPAKYSQSPTTVPATRPAPPLQ